MAINTNTEDRVHIGGYVSKTLKRKLIKHAKREVRGNNSAMFEKMLQEGVERREAK